MNRPEVNWIRLLGLPERHLALLLNAPWLSLSIGFRAGQMHDRSHHVDDHDHQLYRPRTELASSDLYIYIYKDSCTYNTLLFLLPRLLLFFFLLLLLLLLVLLFLLSKLEKQSSWRPEVGATKQRHVARAHYHNV